MQTCSTKERSVLLILPARDQLLSPDQALKNVKGHWDLPVDQKAVLVDGSHCTLLSLTRDLTICHLSFFFRNLPHPGRSQNIRQVKVL